MIPNTFMNVCGSVCAEVMRFYKTGATVSVVSGTQVTIEAELKKHLDMQFPFLKEAFFARFVLVVEGITGYSALPSFGMKLGYDFDEYGISVIEAGGKESVEPILKLLEKFHIPCLGIVDKDEDLEYLDDYKLMNPYILKLAREKISKCKKQILSIL